MDNNYNRPATPAENEIIKSLKQKTKDILHLWNRENHVFQVQKDNAALIVVDMQTYYCTKALQISFFDFEIVIENINRLVKQCHSENIPVIWLRQNFSIDEKSDDSGLYADLHSKPIDKDLCNFNNGTNIDKSMLIDSNNDYQITKKRYSAFINGSSEITDVLKKINRSQLIFTGILANVCVESSIRDAMQLDYKTFIVSDATTSFDRVIHEVTMTNIRLFFGDVYSTEEMLKALK
jgi:ureidoacrylate peracid hydrolase